jgi:hypothetical protein
VSGITDNYPTGKAGEERNFLRTYLGDGNFSHFSGAAEKCGSYAFGSAMTGIVERPALRLEKRGVDVRSHESLFASFSSEKEGAYLAWISDDRYDGGRKALDCFASLAMTGVCWVGGIYDPKRCRTRVVK